MATNAPRMILSGGGFRPDRLPPQCDPPYEETIAVDGAPHQYHVCPPCPHGQIRYYLYPTLDVEHPSLLPIQARLKHEELEKLTCLKHG